MNMERYKKVYGNVDNIEDYLDKIIQEDLKEHIALASEPNYWSFVEFPRISLNANEYYVGNYGGTYFKPKEEGNA